MTILPDLAAPAAVLSGLNLSFDLGKATTGDTRRGYGIATSNKCIATRASASLLVTCFLKPLWLPHTSMLETLIESCLSLGVQLLQKGCPKGFKFCVAAGLHAANAAFCCANATRLLKGTLPSLHLSLRSLPSYSLAASSPCRHKHPG